jgi:uncharacterized membrane protein
MSPVLGVAVCWLVFGVLHIGPALVPVRARLVARLGEIGYLAAYSLAAAASFAWLVRFYARHRFEGPPGLDAGAVPGLRPLLVLVMVGGLALATAALVAYPRTPMALFARTVRPPRGIERISRHGFFAGLMLLAAAHTLLSSRLTGTVFFALLALFTVLGARHQDEKLLALRGEPYRRYLAATSLLPFGAVLAGRQTLAGSDLPVVGLAIGAVLAVGLRMVHGSILGHDGIWLSGAVILGAAVATVQSWRRAHRTSSRRA